MWKNTYRKEFCYPASWVVKILRSLICGEWRRFLTATGVVWHSQAEKQLQNNSVYSQLSCLEPAIWIKASVVGADLLVSLLTYSYCINSARDLSTFLKNDWMHSLTNTEATFLHPIDQQKTKDRNWDKVPNDEGDFLIIIHTLQHKSLPTLEAYLN